MLTTRGAAARHYKTCNGDMVTKIVERCPRILVRVRRCGVPLSGSGDKIIVVLTEIAGTGKGKYVDPTDGVTNPSPEFGAAKDKTGAGVIK